MLLWINYNEITSLENTRRCPVTMNIKTGEQNVDEVKPDETETYALSLGK